MMEKNKQSRAKEEMKGKEIVSKGMIEIYTRRKEGKS